MQVSELEIVLFLYGVGITWLYLREYGQHLSARKFLVLLLENKEAREKMVQAHTEFMRRSTRENT